MTQSSTSRNTRTSGHRRPALALAFGTAAAASVLAPVASMAVTPLPINNDSLQTAAQANVEITAQVKAAIDAAPAVKPYATKYNAAVLAEGKAHAAYTAAVKSKNKAKIATATKLWNPKKTGTTQKTLLTATANYKGSKGAYTKYFTAHGAALKATITGQHFKLTNGTFGGSMSSAPHLCSSAVNMTATELKAAEGSHWDLTNSYRVNPGDGDPTSGDLILRCNTTTGRIEYFLKTGPDNQNVGTWEYYNASATVLAGRITAITTATDATGSSKGTFTPYIANFVSLPSSHSVTPWTLDSLPVAMKAAKKADFGSYAVDVLNKSGAFDPLVTHSPYNTKGVATPGGSCLSAATGATLTCLSYQYSLQEAITAAVK